MLNGYILGFTVNMSKFIYQFAGSNLVIFLNTPFIFIENLCRLIHKYVSLYQDLS